MKYVYLLIFLTIGQLSFAQDMTGIQAIDGVYDAGIKSVTLGNYSSTLRLPIFPLGTKMQLNFDDMASDMRNLKYKVIHCDRNWAFSDLDIFEYLEGFEDEDLRLSEPSRNTTTAYTSYSVNLPNDDISWTLTGNYLLVVWDTDLDDQVILTKRFVSYDNQIGIIGSIKTPSRAEFTNSHHDLQFYANIKDVALDAPNMSLRAAIIQDENWSQSYWNISPRSISGDKAKFDYRNELLFPAVKRFRMVDLRSLDSRRYGVHRIDRYEDRIDVTLGTNKIKGGNLASVLDDDINGSFHLENMDSPFLENMEVNVNDGEYAKVMFTLEHRPPDINEEVFVIGKFNEFQTNDQSRMAYNAEAGVYYKELELRQGIYEYVFAKIYDEEPMSIEDTDGLDNRAEHGYNILIYYSPFSGRYDQVIGYGFAQGNSSF